MYRRIISARAITSVQGAASLRLPDIANTSGVVPLTFRADYGNISLYISCDKRCTMEQKKIDRINELARKSKTEGLTEAEKAEQTELRNEYRASVTGNLRAQLEHTYIMTPDGKKRKVGGGKRK